MFIVRPIQCLARAHAHRLLPYSCKHTLETFQSPIVEWLSECSLTCRLYATNIGGDTVAVMPLCPSCISPYPHSSLFTPLCISALPHSSRVLPRFLPEMHRTKRDVLKQTKKVRWRTRPSQLFLNIFEANDTRNKCGIKLCTRSTTIAQQWLKCYLLKQFLAHIPACYVCISEGGRTYVYMLVHSN